MVWRIFGRYVQDDLNHKGIADRLNAAGVPSPRGDKWSMSTVSGLLSNPAYSQRQRRWPPVPRLQLTARVRRAAFCACGGKAKRRPRITISTLQAR